VRERLSADDRPYPDRRREPDGDLDGPMGTRRSTTRFTAAPARFSSPAAGRPDFSEVAFEHGYQYGRYSPTPTSTRLYSSDDRARRRAPPRPEALATARDDTRASASPVRSLIGDDSEPAGSRRLDNRPGAILQRYTARESLVVVGALRAPPADRHRRGGPPKKTRSRSRSSSGVERPRGTVRPRATL